MVLLPILLIVEHSGARSLSVTPHNPAMGILALCSMIPRLSGLRNTPIMRYDAERKPPSRQTEFKSGVQTPSRVAWDDSLELPGGSGVEQANDSAHLPGRLAWRGARGRQAAQRPGPDRRAAPLGAGLGRRLCNWAPNAAVLVDGTQIKRGNYSPDAQLA